MSVSVSLDHDDPLFHDDDTARERMEAERWPDGVVCPHCCGVPGEAERLVGAAGAFLCGSCGGQFTVLSDTVMEHSQVPPHRWARMAYLLGPDPRRPHGSPLLRLLTRRDRDPQLRLVVDGHRLRPAIVQPGVYRFNVPADAEELRLLSRSVVPAECDPGAIDQRRLGVCVLKFVLESEKEREEWMSDHPALETGFHPAESGHRWTTGDAVLPADMQRRFAGGFHLDVHLASTPLDYISC